MWRERAFYGAFYGGISLQTITFYAVPAWMPTFLIRRFHVSLAELGVQYGTVVLIMGCLGVIVGPFLGRWLVARGHLDYNMRISRSEEHTSELQSLMRPSYAVLFLTQKNNTYINT